MYSGHQYLCCDCVPCSEVAAAEWHHHAAASWDGWRRTRALLQPNGAILTGIIEILTGISQHSCRYQSGFLQVSVRILTGISQDSYRYQSAGSDSYRYQSGFLQVSVKILIGISQDSYRYQSAGSDSYRYQSGMIVTGISME